MLVKVINLSRNVHVSCPLLELCNRHVVVFQVKIPQTSPIRQLIYDAAESFTVWISAPKSEALLLTAHASFLTLLVPVWQTGLAKLEVLFFFAVVQLEVVLEEPRVAISPSSVAGSRLSSAGSFLDAGCTGFWSSQSSETTL